MREETKPEERLGRRAFGNFLADVATWARDEKMVKNGLLSHIERHPKDHVMVDRIFAAWDTSSTGSLSLQVRVSLFVLLATSPRLPALGHPGHRERPRQRALQRPHAERCLAFRNLRFGPRRLLDQRRDPASLRSSLGEY